MTSTAPRILDTLPSHPAPLPRPLHEVAINGLVGKPLRLSPEDVQALPVAEVTADFACREGWCVPGLHWEGVALKTLLREAYADPTAPWVQVSAGEFSTCLSREQADVALVALCVGSEALSHEHGGPFRLVVPGAECYTSIKWIDRIEVRATPAADAARRIALTRISQ